MRPFKIGFKPPLELGPGQIYPVVAAKTAQTYIGSYPHDPPIETTTGMRLPQSDDIVYLDICAGPDFGGSCPGFGLLSHQVNLGKPVRY